MGNEQNPNNGNEQGGQGNGGDYIEVNEISGGTVAIGREAQAIGTFIEHMEKTAVAGDYVDRREITNIILISGSDGLDELTERLVNEQGLSIQIVRDPGAHLLSEQADRQIEEVLAAQRETAVKGVSASPEASYRLGILAAYRRDYEVAITYFQEAGNADPDYSDAFEAIAWLQQSLAMKHLDQQDYDGALDRLAKARTAARHTNPLDLQALALRGYIAKTLAQIADRRQDPAGRSKYYAEAASLFEHIVMLDPDNASAHNGLANVFLEAGNIDAAIASSLQALALAPHYTAAHHDLALAYEAKWRQEPEQGAQWCALALAAWREAYHLAPDDPGFTADRILKIGQQIRRLEQNCG